MEEVQNKWDTLKLNDDIWAKLIYFEQNRRLAKAYVSAPVLTIDGSTNGLDGFRIGLSGIDNTYRNLDSVASLRSIGQGIKLKIDSQGNILIRKISSTNSTAASNTKQQTPAASKCSVWIRDWPNHQNVHPTSSSSSSSNSSSASTFGRDIAQHKLLIDGAENCTMREIEHADTSYKLFDMKRFRHFLERRKSMTASANKKLDWRHCVSIISFVQNRTTAERPGNILDDPCWIMIINIIAIDMIKSIICDDRATINSQQSMPLVHQHSLLSNSKESSLPADGQLPANNWLPSIMSNRSRPQNQLRSSSSTSMLYQPSSAVLPVVPSSTGLASGQHVATKKPRTSQHISSSSQLQSRPWSSALRDSKSHTQLARRYQSSQQLSNGNNIIYTTFNSKYINKSPHYNHYHHHQQGDVYSTSDYYSGSRSSTNGNAYDPMHHHRHGYTAASSVHGRRQTDAPAKLNKRGPFARGEFVRQLEHNRSQSSLDLNARRFELKPIQSAIRMNYDHFSEAEDFYEDDEKTNNDIVDGDAYHHQQPESFLTKNSISGSKSPEVVSPTNVTRTKSVSNSPLSSDCTSPGSNRSDRRRQTPATTKDLAISSDSINHNECQAMQNTSAVLPTADVVNTASNDHQKMSRSSLTSSLSSSGCADNDYFMSHSSSSMSTSTTASQERELLSSQPASSSGIACSAGSTSDEYDDNSRQHRTANESRVGNQPSASVAANCSSSNGTTTTKENQLKSVAKNRRLLVDTAANAKANHSKTRPDNVKRGHKIKTIEPPTTEFAGHRFDNDEVDSPLDCGCADLAPCGCDPPLAVGGFDCECCACDCLMENQIALESAQPLSCCHDCDTSSSIYDCLPAPESSLKSRLDCNGKSIKVGTGEGRSPEQLNRQPTDESMVQADTPTTKKKTAPLSARSGTSEKATDGNDQHGRATKSTSSLSPGWLEKRKYGRIFPKFIFTSSNSSSRRIATADEDTKTNMRGKSSTLDSNAEKFRLTHSNQDLS